MLLPQSTYCSEGVANFHVMMVMMWWYDDDDNDDDDDDDHDDCKCATSSEQYIDWGKNINYISMRDQHLPPPMNNMLFGVATSTVSSWGNKIYHPLWTICWLG